MGAPRRFVTSWTDMPSGRTRSADSSESSGRPQPRSSTASTQPTQSRSRCFMGGVDGKGLVTRRDLQPFRPLVCYHSLTAMPKPPRRSNSAASKGRAPNSGSWRGSPGKPLKTPSECRPKVPFLMAAARDSRESKLCSPSIGTYPVFSAWPANRTSPVSRFVTTQTSQTSERRRSPCKMRYAVPFAFSHDVGSKQQQIASKHTEVERSLRSRGGRGSWELPVGGILRFMVTVRVMPPQRLRVNSRAM